MDRWHMKHIELLTVESYLKEKRETVENIGYTLEEIHIDHVENIDEIIEQIVEEYFEHSKREKRKERVMAFGKSGKRFEIEISNPVYWHKEYFENDLKEEYEELSKNRKESVIIGEIENALQEVFEYSSRRLDGIELRMYEILKYTLTREERCDYFENGQFISEMREGDIFPFEMVDDKLPIYCQTMQRVLFGVHRKIFINPKDFSSEDITKFSFYNTKKIIKKITELLGQQENREDYREGAEDFLLLDRILGISLTNIIYWKTKEITERETQDEIIRTVCQLGKCNCLIERNLIAQVLLDYLKATEYNKGIMQTIARNLGKYIKAWNEYHEEIEAVVLCSVFMGLEKCPVDDLVEACEIIEDGKAWNEYIYLEEIIADNAKKVEKQKEEEEKAVHVDDIMDDSKIRIPKKAMDNKTWYSYIHKAVFEAIWS